MEELALEYKAINLIRPSNKQEVSKILIDSMLQKIKTQRNYYAAVFGEMVLRERIAARLESNHGGQYHPEKEITITNGASEALFMTISAFVNEGDEVIIFQPTQDHYAPIVRLNGGIPVYIELKAPDFSFDWNQVQKVITASTKMIILNNPNNPTGTMLNAWDIVKLQKVLNGTNILLVSDESYRNLIYVNSETDSLSSEPALESRSIIIHSFSKFLNVGGWRLGYVLAPEELSRQFRSVYRHGSCSANLPAQLALAEFLNQPEFLDALLDEAEQRRIKVQNALKSSRFEFKASQSTFFQVLNYRNISSLDDHSFVMQLLKEHNVATLPLSAFYKQKTDESYIRICISQTDDDLDKALDVLVKQ